MKMLSDFLALILFFVVYGIAYHKIDPKQAIYYATAVAVAVTIIQIIYAKIRGRKLDVIQKINYSVIVIFGIIGIIFHNPLFLYWKPSIISWLMASALGISQIINKNGLKLLLKKEITLPDIIWNRLTYAWITFLICIGAINLFVAFNFEEVVWVNYKTFGAFGITLVFALAQGIYLSRHVVEEKKSTTAEE